VPRKAFGASSRNLRGAAGRLGEGSSRRARNRGEIESARAWRSQDRCMEEKTALCVRDRGDSNLVTGPQPPAPLLRKWAKTCPGW